jgi:N-acyl amino acid synthase of PEP-CTERM/exosortase system
MPGQLDGFSPYFNSRRVTPDVDGPLMQRIHALRYEVYCLECKFLHALDYPEGLESDKHDAESAHFCAMDRSERLSGYVRLVPADADGCFPFQTHCPSLFDAVVLPDPRGAGEISRLMVHSHYRRRRGDTLAGFTVVSETEPAVERRNDSPQIMLSMFRQMYVYSLSSGIRYWYAAMERTLARALMRLGFAFNPIGPETDYYGPVAPYLADLRELELKVGEAKPDLLTWMREPLA